MVGGVLLIGGIVGTVIGVVIWKRRRADRVQAIDTKGKVDSKSKCCSCFKKCKRNKGKQAVEDDDDDYEEEIEIKATGRSGLDSEAAYKSSV